MNPWNYGVKKLAAVNSEIGAGLKSSIITDGIITDSLPAVNTANATYSFFKNGGQRSASASNFRDDKFSVGEAFVVYGMTMTFQLANNSNIAPFSTSSDGNYYVDVIIGNKTVVAKAQPVLDTYETYGGASETLMPLRFETPIVIPPMVPFEFRVTVQTPKDPTLYRGIGIVVWGMHALLNIPGSKGGVNNLVARNQFAANAMEALNPNEQGTTWSLRDQVLSSGATFKFFDDFAGKTELTTNPLAKKLDAKESAIIKQFSLQAVNGETPWQQGYGTNLSITVGNQVRLKYFACGVFGNTWHPDRLQAFLPTPSVVGYRMKANAIVIPPNVEFSVLLDNVNNSANPFEMAVKFRAQGYGKLFNPGAQL